MRDYLDLGDPNVQRTWVRTPPALTGTGRQNTMDCFDGLCDGGQVFLCHLWPGSLQAHGSPFASSSRVPSTTSRRITQRGNAREAIALADDDREDFIQILGTVVERYRWRCHAYCLMTNHYHLLIETPTANLSRGMRQMNGLYTQRFNRRHARVGHVFQGRFASIVVDRESYLLELARYVVLNPAGEDGAAPGRLPVVKLSGDRGAGGGASWLTTGAILREFGPRRAAARERYRAFVSEGVGRVSPWDGLRGQVLLGSDAFVERLEPALRDRAEVAEVPKRQRLAGRPSLATLLPRPRGGAGKAGRDRTIREAVLDHGYTLAAVARHVGLHYATISKIANHRVNSDPRCAVG